MVTTFLGYRSRQLLEVNDLGKIWRLTQVDVEPDTRLDNGAWHLNPTRTEQLQIAIGQDRSPLHITLHLTLSLLPRRGL